jgi:hypothetical protein
MKIIPYDLDYEIIEVFEEQNEDTTGNAKDIKEYNDVYIGMNNYIFDDILV